MLDIKPSRKMRRLHLQSRPHRNKSKFGGVKIQIIAANDGSHRVIRHQPKPSIGIYKPKNQK